MTTWLFAEAGASKVFHFCIPVIQVKPYVPSVHENTSLGIHSLGNTSLGKPRGLTKAPWDTNQPSIRQSLSVVTSKRVAWSQLQQSQDLLKPQPFQSSPSISSSGSGRVVMALGRWQTRTFSYIVTGQLCHHHCPANQHSPVKYSLLLIFPGSPNRCQAEISGEKPLFSPSYTLLLAPHTTRTTCASRVIHKLCPYSSWLLSLPSVKLQAAWDKSCVVSLSPSAPNVMPITQ